MDSEFNWLLWEDKLQKKISSQFSGLWLQTQNLWSLIKKACTSFWEGRRALAIPKQMSDSDTRIFFYMSLYWGKKKKRLGAHEEEQLTILLGSEGACVQASGCSKCYVFWVVITKSHFFLQSFPFPLESSSVLVRLGMCFFVLLFFSPLCIVTLNWILLRNN